MFFKADGREWEIWAVSISHDKMTILFEVFFLQDHKKCGLAITLQKIPKLILIHIIATIKIIFNSYLSPHITHIFLWI